MRVLPKQRYRFEYCDPGLWPEWCWVMDISLASAVAWFQSVHPTALIYAIDGNEHHDMHVQDYDAQT